MQPRLKTLQRLVALYAAVEEMELTGVRRMTAAVREVRNAIEVEHEAAQSARIDGRAALLTGDRESWMMVESLLSHATNPRREVDLAEAPEAREAHQTTLPP